MGDFLITENMKIGKVEITESNIIKQFNSQGLSITIDGVPKWILYNFQHSTWDFSEGIFIVDLILQYFSSDGNREKIEIEELTFQYLWTKK